jgi:hypothetical protein
MDEQLLFFLITIAFVIIVFICVNKFYLGLKVISIVSVTLLIFSVLNREFKEFKTNNPTVVDKLKGYAAGFTNIFGKKKLDKNNNLFLETDAGGKINVTRVETMSNKYNQSNIDVTKPVNTDNMQGNIGEPFCTSPNAYATCQIERPRQPNPYCPDAGERARENMRLVPKRKERKVSHSLDDRIAAKALTQERSVEAINRHINGNKYRKEKYINEELKYAERSIWWEDPKYNDMRPDYRIAETLPRRDKCTARGSPAPNGLNWPVSHALSLNNHKAFHQYAS